MKIKERTNERNTIHTNKHKIYPVEANIGENIAQRQGLCSALFVSIFKTQIQRNGHSIWNCL